MQFREQTYANLTHYVYLILSCRSSVLSTLYNLNTAALLITVDPTTQSSFLCQRIKIPQPFLDANSFAENLDQNITNLCINWLKYALTHASVVWIKCFNIIKNTYHVWPVFALFFHTIFAKVNEASGCPPADFRITVCCMLVC